MNALFFHFFYQQMKLGLKWSSFYPSLFNSDVEFSLWSLHRIMNSFPVYCFDKICWLLTMNLIDFIIYSFWIVFVFIILLGPLINSQFKWFNGQRGGMNVRVRLIAFSKIFVLWSCLLIKLNVVHRRCHTMVRFMFMMLLIIPDRQPLTAIVSLIWTQTEIVKWIRNSDWWQDFFCLSFTCHRIHIIIIVTNGNEIFFYYCFDR